ncbi:MAG TPA: branched-chain amino acid ABC transporter ATP-binding protein/permease [Acidimicrobiales bacterium]|nr:branched-chain amino acid ABC transporter ATP-binding protein/permease [Acidimicrobiales bacterium]
MKNRPGLRVIVIGAAASLVAPALVHLGLVTEYAAFVIGTGVALAAAAMSLNLLMGYAGQVSLGQYLLLGVGAFMSGWFTPATRLGLPFLAALPAAALAGAAAAFLVGLPALRLRGLYLAVVTIALSFTLTESIFRARSIGGGSAGIALPRPQVNNFIFTNNGDYLGVLVALFVLVWWFDTNVTRTTLGRAFRAIKSDESVAASFGVEVTAYKLGAFALSGAMAGVAGMMYAHLVGTVNSESFQFEKSLLLVVVVVVGGLGSRVGVLSAASFYALFPVVMPTLFGNRVLGYDLVIGAFVLIVTMARNPSGLAGTLRQLFDERRERARVEAVNSTTMPPLPVLPRPSALGHHHDHLEVGGAVLECTDIRVHFGGLVAVDNASLVVPRNRIVGLIGPNGAGKTTLFDVLSGRRRPDSGRVDLLGNDVSSYGAARRARAGLGRTFQNIGLARDLSVTENFLLAQHSVAGYDPFSALLYTPPVARGERELRERAAAAIEALGFERYARTPVGNLSIGQQRIVELGAVLLTAPEVVLLDEPAAGMSPAAAESLAARLIDLRALLGRTVLLIEHNIPLVMATCDHVYVMAAGRVIAQGSPADVVRDDLVVEAYLGGAV